MTGLDFANRRRALGLTQKEMAERAGVNRVTILNLEAGRIKKYDQKILDAYEFKIVSKTFEERHGWSPDSDYDLIKCNKTPKEIAKLITDSYGDLIKKLGEE